MNLDVGSEGRPGVTGRLTPMTMVIGLEAPLDSGRGGRAQWMKPWSR